jgi:hypothetical protein
MEGGGWRMMAFKKGQKERKGPNGEDFRFEIAE